MLSLFMMLAYGSFHSSLSIALLSASVEIVAGAALGGKNGVIAVTVFGLTVASTLPGRTLPN